MENTDALLIGVIIVLIVGYNVFVSPNFSVMGVVTTLWKVLSWIITLHEIYTWFYLLLHTTLHSLSLMDLITTLWAILRVLLEELEVMREAFAVFDENCDGFIDANELEKVVCEFGFSDVSQEMCQRMIATFDENGDGKIDLREFIKLLE
ncbi:calcium-binding EF-hand family protein [Actinidia rufa]|uniref:Calcium-binding EF-hand family protein n=1 Tax=Actinidia rufa TaxID=165716 RepID=A0A7J0H3G5_9ERIC|nr:calcium-binding EF-hand family protein [Actinidia rufa]